MRSIFIKLFQTTHRNHVWVVKKVNKGIDETYQLYGRLMNTYRSWFFIVINCTIGRSKDLCDSSIV